MNTFRNIYPIVDFFRKTNALGCFEEVIQSQWFTKEKLVEIQFRRLKNLLVHCQKNVPYYKRVFAESEFDVNKIQTLDELQNIPLLDKDLIRNHFEELKSSNFHSYSPRLTQTGGTTGKPLITYKDRISHSYLWGNNLRAWSVGGYNIGDSFIHLASGSLLPKASNLKNRIYNILQNAILVTSYHLTDDVLNNLVNIINKKRPMFIYGYSSSIFLLSTFIKNKRIVINGNLKAVFATSDMLLPWQRKIIEQALNASVFDIYGCPEGGIISFECKEHSGYHVNEESAYIEILDKNESSLGLIVSTPLFNYAFPLIRYKTGDVGSLNSSICQCGRHLSKISELGGRIRDFIRLRDGRYIHGAFFNHLEVFYKTSWIQQYQIIQENLDELTIRLSCIGEPQNKDTQKIISDLRKGLMNDLKINFDFSGVEYTSGGKFRLVISKVSSGWD